MAQDVATLEKEAVTLASTAGSILVTDADSFQRASELLKSADLYIKRVGEVLDPIVEANFRAHRIAVAQRNELLGPAKSAKAILGQRMAIWEQEQARLRREAMIREQREREQAERVERERAAAETLRLQAEAETRRIEEAAAMEARGDGAAAEQLLAAPVIVGYVMPAPVFTPQPTVAAPPKVEGVSFRTDWDFEIVDSGKIPREFLVPDEKKIRGVVKAMKGLSNIPGVRAVERRVTSVRS